MLVFALLARLVSCANVVHDRYYIHISRLSMFTLQLVMLQLGFFSTNKQDPLGTWVCSVVVDGAVEWAMLLTNTSWIAGND